MEGGLRRLGAGRGTAGTHSTHTGSALSASSSDCGNKMPCTTGKRSFCWVGGLIFGDIPVPPKAAGRGGAPVPARRGGAGARGGAVGLGIGDWIARLGKSESTLKGITCALCKIQTVVMWSHGVSNHCFLWVFARLVRVLGASKFPTVQRQVPCPRFELALGFLAFGDTNVRAYCSEKSIHSTRRHTLGPTQREYPHLPHHVVGIASLSIFHNRR